MTAPRILLTGASGQLGSALSPLLPRIGEVVAPTRAAFDLRCADAIRRELRAIAPTIVVNAAAYTAVDAAETDAGEAAAVNAVAPAVLAEECARVNALLVHVSTDYVFDGTRRTPYDEASETAPLNVYGGTKRDGERAVLASGARALIVRTGWLYAVRGRNFLNTMLRLAERGDLVRVVDDQIGTPTAASFVAGAIATMVERVQARALDAADAPWGVYHVVAGGVATWYDFAARIFAEAARRGVGVPALQPIRTSDYPTAARRPPYSVLDASKARRTFGIEAPAWTELLGSVMDERLRAVGA